MVYLLQAEGIFSQIFFFLMFFVFIFLYPRLMLSQLIYKIEQSARKMEEMSHKANMLTAKKAGARSREMKNAIDEFTDFFVVEPSAIDPYGLVRKIDQTIRSMESRFTEFVDEIAGGKSYKEKQELNYGLRAAIGLRQISKIVRHFVEQAKKFKNLQIAMILQMQLPMIEKIAESEFHGTEAFVSGWPIGDSIGPLSAASLIDKSGEIAEDIVSGKTTIKDRTCFVLKAKGPEPHLGRIDEAIAYLMKRNAIARVITIDAAQKLEGEKSGSVAEGIGFAMGGIGQREMIENVLLPKKIPVDSIVVKVGMEDAIMPMKKDIFKSLPKVKTLVEKAVSRAKKGQKVIIIGVGNSSGIGDTKKTVEDVEKIVNELDRQYKKVSKEKKGGWI
ncbi:MAG: DUF1512 family protein [Candidatus Aenigmarchaeota archaeon]|nr:DUF1512 family protein [Candidatus Aenigmarchaeota archaeon]